jgi:phytol kinase
VTPLWTVFGDAPWLAAGAFMAAFLALVGLLFVYARVGSPQPESVRKLLHVGAGLLTLCFPFLFHEPLPVLLLTGLTATIFAAIKFVPFVHAHLGAIVGGNGRTTLGEIYFPVSVVVVFWLALGQSPLLYCIPILVLTLADATGAIIGMRYGRHQYVGTSKSLEGSVAFFVVAWLCINVPLVLWSELGAVKALLLGATLALLVMLLEGSAWRGLDNLFIPIGGFFLLRAWLGLETSALLARFVTTVTLVGVVVLFRRTTTLEDDALLAGAFLCYVTWALAGWHWLVPPAIAFAGYAWMSPKTPENSRRIHDVSAVLAVWAAALVWLTLARSAGEMRLIYPFALVFAGHVAIFGASRLAGDFPDRPLNRLVMTAIVKSWLMVFVPFLLVEGPSTTNVLLALAAGAGIVVAVSLFVGLQPAIRSTPTDLPRWVRQATCAGAGSAAGWLALRAIDHLARGG